MEKYLSKLLEEFEEQYKPVSRMQSLYEARMKLAVQAAAQRLQPKAGAPTAVADPAADTGPADPALPANEPWDAIANLPHVKRFIGPLGGGRN